MQYLYRPTAKKLETGAIVPWLSPPPPPPAMSLVPISVLVNKGIHSHLSQMTLKDIDCSMSLIPTLTNTLNFVSWPLHPCKHFEEIHATPHIKAHKYLTPFMMISKFNIIKFEILSYCFHNAVVAFILMVNSPKMPLCTAEGCQIVPKIPYIFFILHVEYFNSFAKTSTSYFEENIP